MNTAIRNRPIEFNLGKLSGSLINQRNKAFGFMIIGALLAFEVFNYSTTDFALTDVLGNLTFAGLRWSTILSLAFCGIDFAGIARLFTPEQGADEPMEVWYLFGAWVLAAAMNAALTWWGVSVAIANHTSQGTAVVSSQTIQTVVPIFVAVMVWVIRILIIGTFSLAGERMIGESSQQKSRTAAPQQSQQGTPARNNINNLNHNNMNYQSQRGLAAAPAQTNNPRSMQASAAQTTSNRSYLAPASSIKSAPKPAQRTESSFSRPAEPTYHNLADDRQVELYEKRS